MLMTTILWIFLKQERVRKRGPQIEGFTVSQSRARPRETCPATGGELADSQTESADMFKVSMLTRWT